MFKQNEIKGGKNAETIIGESVKVKGDFHAKGNIVVEGILDGSVKTAGDLYVGNKANLKANVEAKNAHIEGVVSGNITIKEYLEIGPSAKILGDIQATSLSIAKGAILNGQCTMSADEEAKKEKQK